MEKIKAKIKARKIKRVRTMAVKRRFEENEEL